MTFLAPIVYISVPLLCAAFIFIFYYKIEETKTWLKCWLIMVVIAILVPSIWAIYLTIIVVGLKLIPKAEEERIFYYLALFCALPKMPYFIPFPGIEGILILTYPMLLGLVLLLPIFLQLKQRKEKLNRLDRMVMWFVIITTVLDFRDDSSITQTGRAVITNFIVFWLPYRVISQSKSDLSRLMLALLMLGVGLAIENVFEWMVVWKTFTTMVYNIPGLLIDPLQLRYVFRGLGVRVASSWFTNITFGVFMATVCIMVANMHKIGMKRNLITIVLVAASFMSLMFTDSRGALLTLIISFYASFYFYKAGKLWKSSFKLVTLVLVVVGFLNVQTLYDLDTSGSFQYRADLLVHSMDAFHSAPIIGDPDFRNNRVLVANMTQGQGIVDIVNHYLRVLLRYGILGLALYLAIWLYTITQVTKRVSKLQAIGDPKYQSGSLLVSCLIGVAVVIYTVSLVGYLSEFIFILWALGSSYLKNTEECVNTARTNS